MTDQKLAPCGTTSAYSRHRRRGEACAPCEAARAVREAEGINKRRAAWAATADLLEMEFDLGVHELLVRTAFAAFLTDPSYVTDIVAAADNSV